MVAYEICHSFLALKEQYVRDLKNDFDASLAAHDEFLENRRRGQIPPDRPYDLKMNLVILSPMAVPHDILVRQVFEQTSSGSRACMLTSVLLRSIDSLNESIEQRNALVQEYRDERDKWQDRPDCFYFGRSDQQGHTDERYPDAVSAISSLTDDCIQFSRMLFTDLIKHGKAIHKQLGKRAEKVNKPNLVKAEEMGLMPDPANYEQWETGFRKQDS